MSKPSESKLVSRTSLVVDAVLVAGFFLLLYKVIKGHVPSNDVFYIRLWGGLAAACMTGVFYLTIQMFRVVLKAQLAAKSKS